MSRFGQKAYTVEEATRRMERYCAYQERCHQEVVAKLRSMRMIPEAIDQIAVHLIQHGFLNEERFARAFVRGKFSQKSWGRNRLRRELKQRDIAESLIRRSLEELEEDTYLQTLDRLAHQRWEALRSEGQQERKKQKLVNYLLYRGWESDLVFDKVAELSRKP